MKPRVQRCFYNQLIAKLRSDKYKTDATDFSILVESQIKNGKLKMATEEIFKKNLYNATGVKVLIKSLLELIYGDALPNRFAWLSTLYLAKKQFDLEEVTKPDALATACELFIDIYDMLIMYALKSGSAYNVIDRLMTLPSETTFLIEKKEEYHIFIKKYVDGKGYVLLRLVDECQNSTYHTHIALILQRAMDLAKQFLTYGFKVDFGLLAIAAAGHFIGKCHPDFLMDKVDEQYHYFFTSEWYQMHHMPYAKHIAMTHSIWDLELENLKLESLILIYSNILTIRKTSDVTAHDFFDNLKGQEIQVLKKHALDLGFTESRFGKVIKKLQDFEKFLHALYTEKKEDNQRYYAMLEGEAISAEFKNLALLHNIKVMHIFRDVSSLNTILENARSEVDRHRFRNYLQMLSAYRIYFNTDQKKIVMSFLYESLTHNEEDIRKLCAEMMGEIIATYDHFYLYKPGFEETYHIVRKEGITLFKTYIAMFLEADVSTSLKHAIWIGNTLTYFIKAILQNANFSHRLVFSRIIVNRFESYHKNRAYHSYLLRVLKYLPLDKFKNFEQISLLDIVYKIVLQSHNEQKLEALEAMDHLMSNLEVHMFEVECYTLPKNFDNEAYQHVYDYINNKIKAKMNPDIKLPLPSFDVSTMYLSNLKTATPTVVKRIQINMLSEALKNNRADAFYSAMHFSNILKVSAFEEVRIEAGNALVEAFNYLGNEQKNDIVIELLRSLEIEGYRFTKFIPSYIGQLINELSYREYTEIIDDFNKKVKSSNLQISSLVFYTAAVSLSHYFLKKGDAVEDELIKKIFTVFFNGIVHYDQKISQSAFGVVGKYIFESEQLSLAYKCKLFKCVGKKILTSVALCSDVAEAGFMVNALAFNHIYKFIDAHEQQIGVLAVKTPQKIAFFPGSFDPFSLAHLKSATKIRNMGFEVYLAIDEFSWSKRTQPNMVRRQIAKMSIADEYNIYVFPKQIVINIANPYDLNQLQNMFAQKCVYLVVGSDVLTHASAYKKEAVRAVILNLSHIVFERNEDDDNTKDSRRLEEVISQIKGEVIRMTLPAAIEAISSTQIRTYVDQNRDISDLAETMVQSYIYEKGLYRHEPLFKDTMTVRSMNIEIIERFDEKILREVCVTFSLDFTTLQRRLQTKIYQNAPRMLLIRDLNQAGKIIAVSFFHWLRSSMIYYEFQSHLLSAYIRENAIGRIIVIDAMLVDQTGDYKKLNQVILTETLAFCLSKDYTYAIYNAAFKDTTPSLAETLQLQGFIETKGEDDHTIYTVDMSEPITLSLDCKAMIKSPYRNAKVVDRAIDLARQAVQASLCTFNHGHLVMSLDRTMMYEHLIKKICDANGVSTKPADPRVLGDNMCVTYGDLFKRWRIPNTVTKALHTERFYNKEATAYCVENHPYYLDLGIQARTIKSFKRPVILVDDLMDKGYRLKAILNRFKKQQIEVKELATAILTGRGKAWLDMHGIAVDSAYYIPKILFWFNEAMLYPFIGGDSLTKTKRSMSSALPSINLILPYMYPNFIKGVSREKIAAFSLTCLKSAYRVMMALETAYLEEQARNLTIAHLSDVLISARYPDKGHQLVYDKHAKASKYIEDDIIHMMRIMKRY